MKFGLIMAGWFLVAVAIGASGALRQIHPPLPQIILASLTILLLAAWRVSKTFRAWLDAVDLRVLIAIHLTRFVGFYFLFLCGRGELPCTFARTAGWGDVVVATFAAVLLASWKVVATRPGLLTAWNLLGLADILFVVGNAARHGIADPPAMAAMLQFPLSLLITFLVPIIIATHVFIFSRLSGGTRPTVRERR